MSWQYTECLKYCETFIAYTNKDSEYYARKFVPDTTEGPQVMALRPSNMLPMVTSCVLTTEDHKKTEKDYLLVVKFSLLLLEGQSSAPRNLAVGASVCNLAFSDTGLEGTATHI